MADSVVLICPECDKQLKAPANADGKKIRCRACGHMFTAKVKPSAKASAAPKPPPRDNASDYKLDNIPYKVTNTDLTPRCPQCAGELEDADAVICLHCGYNRQTRERTMTKKLHHTTGMDWFLWLLPPILCAIMFFALIGVIVFLWLSMAGIVERNKDEWWAFAPRVIQLWGTILCLFIMFFFARFSIKRLIFHPTPPEREKN